MRRERMRKGKVCIRTTERFIVTTFRLPKDVHNKMKRYVKNFNYNVRWWDRKLSLTVLAGKAFMEYMGNHPLENEENEL